MILGFNITERDLHRCLLSLANTQWPMILLNQWCLTSVHCTLHSSRLIESSIFPNQISFDLLAAECAFSCNGFHFGKTNKRSEHMKQQMWSVCAPRFLTGTSFDKAYWQKGTFTALQSPNIYSSSTAAYEKTLLIQPSSICQLVY